MKEKDRREIFNRRADRLQRNGDEQLMSYSGFKCALADAERLIFLEHHEHQRQSKPEIIVPGEEEINSWIEGRTARLDNAFLSGVDCAINRIKELNK